jgi:hypothetical protein
MSDDIAQTILCLGFTIPATGLLVVALMRKTIGGSDVENSAPILNENDVKAEGSAPSKGARRLSAISIGLCLAFITALTIVTLFVAGVGEASSGGKCPLGF